MTATFTPPGPAGGTGPAGPPGPPGTPADPAELDALQAEIDAIEADLKGPFDLSAIATDDHVLHAPNAFAWSANRPYRYGPGTGKDGLFFVRSFTDNSGIPAVAGVYQSYTKLIGGYLYKNGPGNMDAFWASISHKGPDEVGLFIGDCVVPADSPNAGRLWGGHFRLSAFKDAHMRGLMIELNPQVPNTSASFGLEVVNGVAANAIAQGIRVRGKWSKALIVYSDVDGVVPVFDIDGTNGTTQAGHVNPIANQARDLGNIAARWRTLFVNNLLLNGADSGGGSGLVAIKNVAVAPTTNPPAGGVLYVDAGALKFRGSAGTTTTVAPA